MLVHSTRHEAGIILWPPCKNRLIFQGFDGRYPVDIVIVPRNAMLVNAGSTWEWYDAADRRNDRIFQRR